MAAARTSLTGLALLAALLSGCSGFELTPTGLECQRTPIGGGELREGEDPVVPGGPLAGVEITSMTAAEVGDTAAAAGFGVTYRNEYKVGEQPESGSVGYAECWCEPPPGRVTGAAYDSIGRVIVFVDSGEHRDAVRPQPERGWGCGPEPAGSGPA